MEKLVNIADLTPEERLELQEKIEMLGGSLDNDGLTPEEVFEPEPKIYPLGTKFYRVDMVIDGKLVENVEVTEDEYKALLSEGKIKE